MPRPDGLAPVEADGLRALAARAASRIAFHGTLARRDDVDPAQVRHQAHDAATAAHEAPLEASRPVSDARLADIIESARDYAIMATDLYGTVTYWSDGARHVLGWTRDEMVGTTLARIFTPEDQRHGRLESEMCLALDRGRASDERWHRKAGGIRFWANGELMPLRDAAGIADGFVKIVRDRTSERRREQRMLLLTRAAASLVAAQDPDEVIALLFEESAAALDIDQAYHYVVTPDRKHLDLTHSLGVDAALHARLQAIGFDDGPLSGIVARTRQPLVLESLQDTTDPAYAMPRDLGIQAYAGFPIESNDLLYGTIAFASRRDRSFDAESIGFFGTLARLLSVVRQRLEREARYESLNKSLEDEVRNRTSQLAEREEQLRQSMKMEALGQLTGGIAHDFNNMLASVAGSLELLQRRFAQGRHTEIDRYVGTAQSATRRAAALTHRLLAFARRQTLDAKPTAIGDLVHDIEDLLRRSIGPMPALRVADTFDECVASIDRNQLEHSLINLCINARDAMPEGGAIDLLVRKAVLDDADARRLDLARGDYIEIVVRDAGTGMPPDVVARAFDPFFTTKPLGEGTGLGLSMVYGFARQSGGTVRIRSEVGRGTEVAILLPAVDTAHEADHAAAPVPASEAPDGVTVLVVDDEASIRMVISDALRDLNYTMLEAADAGAAMVILDSDVRIDLLVTDVGLGGHLNGRQLADFARVTRPMLRVLFVTGYAEGVALRDGRLSDGMEILTKPFAIDVLSERVERLIGLT